MTTDVPRSGGRAARAWGAHVASAAVVAVLATGCAAPTPTPTPPSLAQPPSASPPDASATPSPAPLAVGRPPASVSIPKIGLTEPLIDLGIQSDGSMEVPVDFGDVGWFTGGGRLGGVGPTVIAGHIDSVTAPAVFARLNDLVDGDRFQVTDVAGSVFDYEVYRVGDYPKADFPTSEVFGALPTDEVRLITCTGLFDTASGHYEDNRVVFARPV